MRTTCRWAARCLAFVTLAVSFPATAGLLFTYTSNDLPISGYAVNGEAQEMGDLQGTPSMSFSFSFTAPEQDLSLQPITTFRFTEFTFSALYSTGDNPFYFPLDLFSSRSGGWVSLDQNGNITAWDVMLRMTELITPETNLFFHRMDRHFIAVKSSSENGDKLSNRFHPSTYHRDQFIQLAKVQLSYSGFTEFSNWTVAKITVPEAGSVGLLVVGALGLLAARRKQGRISNGC